MNLVLDYFYKTIPGYACGYPPYPPGATPPVGRKETDLNLLALSINRISIHYNL